MEHMKEENPKVWWKEVKRLCGAKPSADNVTSHIHIEGIEDMSYGELANVINQAFSSLWKNTAPPSRWPSFPLMKIRQSSSRFLSCE